jgi:HPt (histidine-containing phosphotransfer) domain-containing protein
MASEVGVALMAYDQTTKAISVDQLDMTVLEELRVLDEEDLRELVELYVGDVVSQLANIRAGLGAQDATAVSAAAHRIKGASLSIGAARMAALSADVESAAKDGSLEPVPALVGSLESELDPTKAALASTFGIESPA